MELIIQLVLGAIGGNAGGALMKDKSLGTLGNSVAGAIGGLGGANILGSLLGGNAADAAAAAASSGMLENIVGGGVGGLILQVVASLIKGAMTKTA